MTRSHVFQGTLLCKITKSASLFSQELCQDKSHCVLISRNISVPNAEWHLGFLSSCMWLCYKRTMLNVFIRNLSLHTQCLAYGSKPDYLQSKFAPGGFSFSFSVSCVVWHWSCFCALSDTVNTHPLHSEKFPPTAFLVVRHFTQRMRTWRFITCILSLLFVLVFCLNPKTSWFILAISEIQREYVFI